MWVKSNTYSFVTGFFHSAFCLCGWVKPQFIYFHCYVAFHCMSITQYIHPFYCWRLPGTFGLLKTMMVWTVLYILSWCTWTQIYLAIWGWEWYRWIISFINLQPYFMIPNNFPKWLFQFILTPVANECCHHWTSSPTLGLVRLLNMGLSNDLHNFNCLICIGYKWARIFSSKSHEWWGSVVVTVLTLDLVCLSSSLSSTV